MNDLISRQAAIDAIERHAYRHTYLDQIIDIVNALPSAEPELATDCISRQAAYETLSEYYHHRTEIQHKGLREALDRVPSAESEIIRCNECKHNPNITWFECPMSHLSESQRPETAWCWKAERRTDERFD